MADKRVATGKGTGLGGDDAAEQNREFGHGDQEFGGGANEEEYGEERAIEQPEEGARPADTGVTDAGEESARERRLGEEEEE